MQQIAQQVHSSIKFGVPAFEDDSAASCLVWSLRVVYQARASGFEAGLTAAEGEELSIEAYVSDSSNIDPVNCEMHT